MAHRNARLTFHGSLILVQRVRVQHRPVAHVAKELGISRQCAHRWPASTPKASRDCTTGPAVHVPARPAPPAHLKRRVLAARRRLRCRPIGLARHTGVPAATCGRILRRHQVPRLGDCDPLTGAPIRTRHSQLRYERDTPGALVHLDVKKIGRIPDGGGWRAHGRAGHHNRGVGYDFVHAAVDD